jgi:hypothetical protein
MTATVLHLADHRLVFVLPDKGSTVVFMASRGPTPRIAHERRFTDPAKASVYGRDLAATYGVNIIGDANAEQEIGGIG